MPKFFADWRNSVLIVTIAGTLVFGILYLSARQTSPVITVGTRTFSEKDVVKQLKEQAGFTVVSNLVTTSLLEDYAAENNVVVTDADVDQLLAFHKRLSELQGQSFDEMLKSQGMTEATYRKQLHADALQVKLLLTPDEIKSAVAMAAKAGGPPFTLPTRYRYRLFTFGDEATANEAIAELSSNSPEGLTKAQAESLDASMSKNVQLYIPGVMKPAALDSFVSSALKGLQPGQCSKPLPSPANKMLRVVFQMVEIEPAIKPTVENSGVAVGLFMTQANAQMKQKYSAKMREIIGKSLDKYDPQFTSADYDAVKDYFQEIKRKNPQIPGANILTEPTIPKPMPGAPARPSKP